MLSLWVVTAIFSLTFAPAGDHPVGIGLFGLFRPESLQVRLASGAGAYLDCSGLKGNGAIGEGDSVRIRAAGGRLTVVVINPYGRVRESVVASEARIAPAGAATFELILPGRMKRVIRGQLLVAARARGVAGGPLRITLETPRESAVASVVAAEMSGQRAPESLKALAVVVRTFMISQAGRHAAEGYDFCDTTHCQLYRGEADLSAEAASPVVANAVASTWGERLGFQGGVIESYYTASCGGLSTTPEMVWGGKGAGGYPYRRVACAWCDGSRYSAWNRSAPAGLVLAALSPSAGPGLSPASELLLDREESSGFVRSVTIRYGRRQTTMSADEFRRRIGRRLGWNTVLSPTFALERRGDSYIFRGRGFGSQIGLCVAGALAQAAAGRAYRDILSFYYPETEVIRVD